MKRVAKWLLIALALFTLERTTYRATRGFRVHKIQDHLPDRPEWASETTTTARLKQPFTYLGAGKQCYAFLGDDGETVLKLFKFQHLKKGGLDACFESVSLAWRSFRDESGLIYAHLNKTAIDTKSLTLIDAIGRQHTLDPCNLRFFVQKYAQLIYDEVDRAMELGKTEQAQAIIRAYLAHIDERSAKGIGDRDPVIFRNLGLADGRVITIDVGQLYSDKSLKDHPNASKQRLEEASKFLNWLEIHYPQLHTYMYNLLYFNNA